ncbi:MAG: hypothetical protein M3O02_08615 [Acidobacteriota bacterium]|nr:hypothetical protein [Acidobacteriota bacterium]
MLHFKSSTRFSPPLDVSHDGAAPCAPKRPGSTPSPLSGPTLVTARYSTAQPAPASGVLDLAIIVSRRCSSFFAEAAVLVLVFGILDFFMLKGRIDLAWIFGALAISVGLLGASIAMDFTAQRWIKAFP